MSQQNDALRAVMRDPLADADRRRQEIKDGMDGGVPWSGSSPVCPYCSEDEVCDRCQELER